MDTSSIQNIEREPTIELCAIHRLLCNDDKTKKTKKTEHALKLNNKINRMYETKLTSANSLNTVPEEVLVFQNIPN